MSGPVILITHHHQDEAEKSSLLEKLNDFEYGDCISIWSDDRIDSQGNWQPAFAQALSEAGVVVLIITANYLNSAFISQPAVGALLQRYRADGLTILPVLARPGAWRVVGWLRQLEVYPEDGTPVWNSDGGDIDGVLTEIVKKIDTSMRAASGRKTSSTKAAFLNGGRKRPPLPEQKPFVQTKRVLVIEDEPGWQRRLDRILSEINCASITAENYDQALDLLNTTDFDLVIVDLNLDKSTGYADGLELMPRIRDRFGGQVPVIILTGTGGLEEQRRAFKEYQVYDFIQKARLDFAELQRLVIQAVGHGNGNA